MKKHTAFLLRVLYEINYYHQSETLAFTIFPLKLFPREQIILERFLFLLFFCLCCYVHFRFLARAAALQALAPILTFGSSPSQMTFEDKLKSRTLVLAASNPADERRRFFPSMRHQVAL